MGRKINGGRRPGEERATVCCCMLSHTPSEDLVGTVPAMNRLSWKRPCLSSRHEGEPEGVLQRQQPGAAPGCRVVQACRASGSSAGGAKRYRRRRSTPRSAAIACGSLFWRVHVFRGPRHVQAHLHTRDLRTCLSNRGSAEAAAAKEHDSSRARDRLRHRGRIVYSETPGTTTGRTGRVTTQRYGQHCVA